jgi:hypothetical protein
MNLGEIMTLFSTNLLALSVPNGGINIGLDITCGRDNKVTRDVTVGNNLITDSIHSGFLTNLSSSLPQSNRVGLAYSASLGRYVAGGYTSSTIHYIAYRIARNKRVGNASDSFGIGQVHGQLPGYPVYLLLPHKDLVFLDIKRLVKRLYTEYVLDEIQEKKLEYILNQRRPNIKEMIQAIESVFETGIRIDEDNEIPERTFTLLSYLLKKEEEEEESYNNNDDDDTDDDEHSVSTTITFDEDEQYIASNFNA